MGRALAGVGNADESMLRELRDETVRWTALRKAAVEFPAQASLPPDDTTDGAHLTGMASLYVRAATQDYPLIAASTAHTLAERGLYWPAGNLVDLFTCSPKTFARIEDRMSPRAWWLAELQPTWRPRAWRVAPLPACRELWPTLTGNEAVLALRRWMELSPEEAIPALEQSFSAQKPDVRARWAAEIPAHHPLGRSALEEMLEDSSREVRAVAAMALAQLPDHPLTWDWGELAARLIDPSGDEVQVRLSLEPSEHNLAIRTGLAQTKEARLTPERLQLLLSAVRWEAAFDQAPEVVTKAWHASIYAPQGFQGGITSAARFQNTAYAQAWFEASLKPRARFQFSGADYAALHLEAKHALLRRVLSLPGRERLRRFSELLENHLAWDQESSATFVAMLRRIDHERTADIEFVVWNPQLILAGLHPTSMSEATNIILDWFRTPSKTLSSEHRRYADALVVRVNLLRSIFPQP